MPNSEHVTLWGVLAVLLDLTSAALSSYVGEGNYPLFVSPTAMLFAVSAGFMLFYFQSPKDEDWNHMLDVLPEDITFDPGESEPLGNGWEVVYIPLPVTLRLAPPSSVAASN
jgi:hypothetical protein